MKGSLLVFINILFSIFSSYGQCCRCNNYGPELVRNGNFSSGNTDFSSAYLFSSNASPGFYGITANSNNANPNYWGSCVDHTTGTGNLIWYDLSSSSSINMWTQQVQGIAKNSNYIFSCWINTLDPSGPATLRFSINGQLVGNSFTAPVTLCDWVQKCFIWNSGNNTSATITIANQSVFASGNDVGIDDISFRLCSPFATTYPDAFICPGQTYQLPNGTIVNAAGTYIDTFHTQDGCDSLRVSTVTVKPVSNNILNISLCPGQSYLGHTTGGTYIDTFIAANGCDSIRTIKLRVNTNTSAIINQSICQGQNFLGHTQSGNYIDTIPNANGCDSIIRTTLNVLTNCEVYFPSVFTPNNDGKNDVFRILNATTGSVKNYNLTIHNRWGQKIFETKNIATGWDGTYNGNRQELGVYVWHSSFYLLGKFYERKGMVVLLR